MTWIRLITEEPELVAVVQRLAPAGTPVQIVDGRGARLVAPAAAVVVATSSTSTGFVVRALEDLETQSLTSRAVVLAPFSRDLATALVRLTCSRVVWLDEVSRDLGPVLHRMVDSDLRFAIAEALLDRCGDDPLLQCAVREAFAGADCPTTVSQLATRAHCTPSTLRAHWRRSTFPDSPQSLVEWAVLAVLTDLRDDGSKISTASRLIGLHETTLLRAARRRVGVPPSMVDRGALLAALDDWLPARAG